MGGIHWLMTLLIGAGTAGLIASSNMITQVGTDQVLRGRMGGLNQIAVLGGGGCSGHQAAALVGVLGLPMTFAISGGAGLALAIWELHRRGLLQLAGIRTVRGPLQISLMPRSTLANTKDANRLAATRAK